MDIKENFYNRLHEARNPELKKLIKKYADHKADAYDSGDSGYDDDMDHHEIEAEKTLKIIKKNHGPEAADHAERAASSNIFGTERRRNNRPDSLDRGLRANLSKEVTKKGIVPKNTQKAMQGVAASGDGVFKRKISKPKGYLPEEQLDELRRPKNPDKGRKFIKRGAKEAEHQAFGEYHTAYGEEKAARKNAFSRKTPEAVQGAIDAGKNRTKKAKRVIRLQKIGSK